MEASARHKRFSITILVDFFPLFCVKKWEFHDSPIRECLAKFTNSSAKTAAAAHHHHQQARYFILFIINAHLHALRVRLRIIANEYLSHRKNIAKH
jgi:hypothetical protein